MQLNIKPAIKRILVKKIDIGEQTSSGIYIPHNSDNTASFGEILNLGSKIEMEAKVGDKVYYHHGIRLKNNQDIFILKEDDILAIEVI